MITEAINVAGELGFEPKLLGCSPNKNCGYRLFQDKITAFYH